MCTNFRDKRFVHENLYRKHVTFSIMYVRARHDYEILYNEILQLSKFLENHEILNLRNFVRVQYIKPVHNVDH